MLLLICARPALERDAPANPLRPPTWPAYKAGVLAPDSTSPAWSSELIPPPVNPSGFPCGENVYGSLFSLGHVGENIMLLFPLGPVEENVNGFCFPRSLWAGQGLSGVPKEKAYGTLGTRKIWPRAYIFQGRPGASALYKVEQTSGQYPAKTVPSTPTPPTHPVYGN